MKQKINVLVDDLSSGSQGGRVVSNFFVKAREFGLEGVRLGLASEQTTSSKMIWLFRCLFKKLLRNSSNNIRVILGTPFFRFCKSEIVFFQNVLPFYAFWSSRGVLMRIKNGFQKMFLVRSIGWADSLVFPSSSAFYDALLAKGKPFNAVVLPHRVPDSMDNTCVREFDEFLAPVRFLAIVSSFQYKNVDILLKWFRDLRMRGDQFKCRLILNGSLQDVESLQLEFDVGVGFGYCEVVRAVSGELSSEFVYADIVVVPSFVESFSLPVIEALRAGCFVLASDIKVHREVGFLWPFYFDPLDTTDLMRAYDKLMGLTPIELERIRIGAVNWVNVRHSAADWRDGLLKIIRDSAL